VTQVTDPIRGRSEHAAAIRDRYHPAQFDAERYSTANLSFWTPVFVRVARIQANHDVLDLGCATGGLTCSIAAATGARLVGCDRSGKLLAYGEHRRGSTAARWVHADGAHLPFPDRTFDRVIASLILHQVADREGVIREVSRVLRTEGVLTIRTVTPQAAKRWIPHRFFPSIAQAQADRMPSTSELTDLLAHVSFSELATETVVRRKQLQLDRIEQAIRRDVPDRFPFVDDAELSRGMRLLRAHWAVRRGDWTDERAFTFIVAVKPSRRGSAACRGSRRT
jgi:ubiquinone/menaquinone biosynthesis C-methylase UbiE